LNDNQIFKIISHGNSLWVRVDQNLDKIKTILSRESVVPSAGEFFYDSLKLIAIELETNKNKYNKYPSTILSEEQLVDIVIESIAENLPNIDDIEKNKTYNDELRVIIWGYMKSNFLKIFRLASKLSLRPNELVNQEDMDLMEDCLAVVFVEAIIRKREMQILENSYL